MDNLVEKIKAANLTKTEKIVADYILDNIDNIGFSTLTDIALKTGVSDTSIIRFIRSIGFGGFADFRNAMQERLLEQYANLSPSQKFTNTKDKLNADSVVTDVFYRAMDNLSVTLLNLDEKLLSDVADCIAKSATKYVVGFRGTACCADYFTRKALFFLPHIVLCDKAESCLMETLVDIGKKDCLLMFTFPRYSKLNYSVMELAKKREAKIILVTDRVTSPLASYADYLITVKVDGVGFTNTYVAPLCIGETLAILIGQKMAKHSNERLSDLDVYIGQNDLY